MVELKLLSREGIPSALAKGERYRLLGQAWEAEKIYLDVLAFAPDNQEALVGLRLALTDQFDQGVPGTVQPSKDVLPRIQGDYARAYYGGVICERRAKAVLRQSVFGAGHLAYNLLEEARESYERAEDLRPLANDDALLRWNACVRLMLRNPSVEPDSDEQFQPYRDS